MAVAREQQAGEQPADPGTENDDPHGGTDPTPTPRGEQRSSRGDARSDVTATRATPA